MEKKLFLNSEKKEDNLNASVAIQILPKTENNEDTIVIVDKVIKYIESYGLKTHVGPFETTIEGDFNKLMEIIKESCLLAESSGAHKIMAYVKINYSSKGDILTIDEKIEKYR